MSSPAVTNLELVTLVRKMPELRMPILKAYSLGYDAGWQDLRRRADMVITILAIVGITALLMVFRLIGTF